MSIRDEIRAAIKDGKPFCAGGILASVPGCEGDRAKLSQNLSAFAESSSFTSFIRRGRDSNPRYCFQYISFQDYRLKPLGHLSANSRIIAYALPFFNLTL